MSQDPEGRENTQVGTHENALSPPLKFPQKTHQRLSPSTLHFGQLPSHTRRRFIEWTNPLSLWPRAPPLTQPELYTDAEIIHCVPASAGRPPFLMSHLMYAYSGENYNWKTQTTGSCFKRKSWQTVNERGLKVPPCKVSLDFMVLWGDSYLLFEKCTPPKFPR